MRHGFMRHGFMRHGFGQIALVLVLGYGVVGVAPVQAQSQCKRVEEASEVQCNIVRLECGSRKYDLGFFTDAVELLEVCLPSDFETADQREWAHRVVALAYYELGDEASAQLWIRSLMEDVNRNYRADSDEPTFFQNQVVAYRPKAWHQRKWVRRSIIPATLGLGLGIWGLARSSDDPTPLPLPPIFPGSN